MKCLLSFALLLAALPLAAQEAREPPQIPFRVAENFLKLPDGVYMAEVVGVSVDSKGRIVVANRGKLPLMEFNPDGSYIRSFVSRARPQARGVMR
jgi:hypothetical protein